MPNIKSAIKDIRKNQKRAVQNLRSLRATKDAVKKARLAIRTKDTNAQELTRVASRTLDRAAKKGIIKKNNAARTKSRLAKALNKL